ncbi:MAG: AAA family ATPase [Thermodesulfobacteriota bacterium]
MPSLKGPQLFIFMGLIASGKSTLAQLFAQRNDLPYYNSDVVRKELAGLKGGAAAAFGAGIYTPEFSRRTYYELWSRALAELSGGKSVVLDGSYHKKSERWRLVEACGTSYDYTFILCTCPPAETRERLLRRAEDPEAVSDGTWDIFVKQQQQFEYPHELSKSHLLVVPTCASPDELLVDLNNRLS